MQPLRKLRKKIEKHMVHVKQTIIPKHSFWFYILALRQV